MSRFRADKELAAEEKLAEETRDMFDLYCPTIQSNCTKDCVHFKAGCVCNGYIILSPRCRLWRS